MSLLREETCIDCGVLFGLPANMVSTWTRDGKQFCCPNGHKQRYMVSTWTRDGKQFCCPNGHKQRYIRPDKKGELEALRTKVKTLEEKVAEQEKRIAELTEELEIWRRSQEAGT